MTRYSAYSGEVDVTADDWDAYRSSYCTRHFGCFMTDQSTLTDVVFTALVMGGGGSIDIDWGDGTKELGWNNANWATGITKTYTVQKDPYYIIITGDVDKIVGIDMNNQPHCYGDISGWVLPDIFQVLEFYANGFSGDLSGWILPATLRLMDIRNNNFEGDVSSWVIPDVMSDFQLSGNDFEGDISAWRFNNDSATHINLITNRLSGDLSGWVLPSGLLTLELNDNLFTGDISAWVFGDVLQILQLYGNSFTGDISGWNISDAIVWYYGQANAFTGDWSGGLIPAGAASIKLNFEANSLTKLPRGEFRWVSVYNFYNNSCSTAEIDALLVAIDAYFVGGVVPLINCSYNLSGTNMAYPTKGDSNDNLVSIKAKYVAASKVATFTVNPIVLPDFVVSDGHTRAVYDYKDLTTITKGGGNPDYVSAWRDKLGSGRDIVQAGADSLKPYYSATEGLMFNGDYLKSASFTFGRPEFIYMVIKQVTWGIGRYIFDGDAGDSGLLYQRDSTPQIKGYDGAVGTPNGGLTIGTFMVVRVLFNGVNSKIIVDEGIPVTWSGGTNNMGGFTLGCRASGTSGATVNIKEVILRDIDDGAVGTNEAEIVAYLKAKYGV